MFGSTNTFGQSSGNIFGSNFGQTNPNLFGNPNPNPNPFGTSNSNPFGNSNSNPNPFGGPSTSTSIFGQPFNGSSITGQNNTGTFNNNTRSTFAFGVSSSSTTGPSSFNFDKTNAFGQTGQTGSRKVAYKRTQHEEDSKLKIESINAMAVYKDTSHEELRWEDYQKGDKGGKNAPSSPFGTNQLNPFGTTQSKPFGTNQSNPFGTTSSNPFGANHSSPFGTNQSRPFGTNTSSPFGTNQSSPFGTNNPSPFGTNQSSPFGTNTSSPFGTNQSSPFGTNNPSPFGTNQSSPFGTNNPSPFGTNQSNPFDVNPTQSSPFGVNSTQSSPFGVNAAQSSPFGANTAQSSPFGANSTQPSPFGTNQVSPFGTNQSSPFGTTNQSAPFASNGLFAQNNTNPNPFSSTAQSNPNPNPFSFTSQPLQSNPNPFSFTTQSNQNPNPFSFTTPSNPNSNPNPNPNPFSLNTPSNPNPNPFSYTPPSNPNPNSTFESTGFGSVSTQLLQSSTIATPSPFGPSTGSLQSNTTSSPFGPSTGDLQPGTTSSPFRPITGGLQSGPFSFGDHSSNNTQSPQGIVTNPFGTLPLVPQLSIENSGTGSAVQYGISSLPVKEKTIEPKIALSVPRHLSRRRVRLPLRKYHPKTDASKVAFYADKEELLCVPKADSFVTPRDNQRRVRIIRPIHNNNYVNIINDNDNENEWPFDNETLTEPESTDPIIQHCEEEQPDSPPVSPPLNDDDQDDSDPNLDSNDENAPPSPTPDSPKKPNKHHNTQKGIQAAIVYEHGAEIEALMPKLRHADYYTVPRIPDMAARERARPGFCSKVPQFVLGRTSFGEIVFEGVTDVRKLDLESIVQFNNKEVVVYKDEKKKPPVGFGLNKPAEVALLNIKCINKKTGERVTEGKRVEKFREMLVKKTEAQGGEFVSYDPIKGEWKFKVNHF